MSGRQIELTWRCSSCGHRNLGRHLICQSCGNPKDDGEVYEMPPDPSKVASVTDGAMLRQARAGANWRCAFCGSDTRAFDGTCAQCGATPVDGRGVAPRTARQAARRARPTSGPRLPLVAVGALVALALIACGIVSVLAFSSKRASSTYAAAPAEPEFRNVQGHVRGAHWKQQISVERWSIVEKEGFAEQKPSDATNVRPLGERVHHTDSVQQGTKTEAYTETVTEMENETYSDQEPCGQDCTTLPQSCHEECTNNNNGYATCHTVCSGGGQSCSPKYCQVQKTRMVPKTKQVPKTRTVPNMVDVPRMAPFFSWKQWDWAKNRTLEETGEGFSPRWPTDEKVALGAALGKGEKERAEKIAEYTVDIVATDGTPHTVHPTTEAELATYEMRRSCCAFIALGASMLCRVPRKAVLPPHPDERGRGVTHFPRRPSVGPAAHQRFSRFESPLHSGKTTR